MSESNFHTMLAIDIGASSGRVIKVVFNRNKLEFETVHRFNNGIIKKSGGYYWNHKNIFKEIKKGISKADEFNSLGIDTWGVDYVLHNGEEIEFGFAYRDDRSYKYYEIADKEKLFFTTGVASLPFNTIFQLQSEKRKGKFLMVPDYYLYLLTGIYTNEYTNMKTTQLDLNNLQKHEFNFSKITSLKVFDYLEDASKKVIQVASHDTASAFIGSPHHEDAIIISLGTWSVIGKITDQVVINNETFQNGFSNEGSIGNRNRLVKNTCGSWIVERVLKELNFDGDYEGLIEKVSEMDYIEVFDVDNKDFDNPVSMKSAIDKYLSRSDYNIYQYAKIIYDSMIEAHVTIISQLEKILNKKHSIINIVGGGSQNSYICTKIKTLTGKKVYRGPVEATIVGNAICQLLALDLIVEADIKTILNNSKLVEEVI